MGLDWKGNLVVLRTEEDGEPTGGQNPLVVRDQGLTKLE